MTFRPLSITGALIGCLVAVIACASAAVGWSWMAVCQAQAETRDARLTALATGVAEVLAVRGGDSAEWGVRVAQVLNERAGEPPGLVQVLAPVADSSAPSRVVVSLPERPEADLPQRDPLVSEALLGHPALVTWFDPLGNSWRSSLVPVRDPNGRVIAIVEARRSEQLPGLLDRGVVLGLLLVAVAIGIAGGLLLLRRIRHALTALDDGIADIGRGRGPLQPGLRQSRELDMLAGSLQKADGEQTTRRLRLQREIADLRVQVVRFQGADRTKTTLLVALCRSLRSSVDSLRSASTLLSQTRLDRTQREYVESLQAGCGDLLTRISDVLDFALLEAECLSLDQRPLRPRLVLEEALLIVAERCSLLPIELAWYADPTVPERVVGDLPRVRQVLVNLVGLAVSTAEEGTVAVHILTEADDRLTFRISLMGVTLTAERIRLLLEGAISNDSSSDRLHGEGLGLVLGKRLAQAMGGSLQIERGEGEDLELVCTLRVAPDDVVPERPLAQRRIIVGHERPATRRMLVGLLERAGAVVETVASHQELVALLDQPGAPPGVVVLSTRLASADDATDAPLVVAGAAALATRVPVVLVVDPVHRGHLAELRVAGAAGLVSVPVRQQQLLGVVGDALSGIKRDSGQVRALAVPAERPPRVLVVEDNEVNQLVLVRMMESLGIQPELAGNGLEAVERLRAATDEPYALVLMDIMMPVMDGLDATRVIRREQDSEPPVWIVAVTANALANDRSTCIEAGMNDYLPKPVTPLALSGAINRWRQATGRKVSGRMTALASSSSNAGTATLLEEDSTAKVDFSGLKTLVRLAGQEAVVEVIDCFLREVEGLRSGVMSAVDDLPRLRAAAHKLKGSSGTVGLRGLQAHAAAIETAAKDNEASQVAPLVAALPQIFAASVAQLNDFRGG